MEREESRKKLNQIDNSDDVTAKRIHESLLIDGVTKPPYARIKGFIQRLKNARPTRRRHSSG